MNVINNITMIENSSPYRVKNDLNNLNNHLSINNSFFPNNRDNGN